MRITLATQEEKDQIYRYWKEAFPNKSGESMDSYFKVYFKPEETYLYKNEEEIVSMAQVKSKVISLNGKNLRTAYITNVLTRPQFQGQGHMTQFLKLLMDEISDKNLITLLRAYEPKVYEGLGFERVIDIAEYRIDSLNIPDYGVTGVILNPQSEELVQAYKDFTSHFDGYYLRDVEYFDRIKQEYALRNGGVAGLSVANKLVGYCLYTNHATHVEVNECVYDKAGTLMRLLSFISKGKSRVLLKATTAEKIEKVFPKVKRSVQPFLLACINDKELFERLYDVRILSAYSAFNAFEKPLFNRDFE